MSFNDYIDKYKKGTLSPEESEVVKNEIEKYEAITRYLCEEDKERASLGIIGEKHVNRKKVRSIIIPLVIVISLIAISTLWINWSFYNPNKGYVGKYGGGQFFIDTSAFTELHSPGYYTNWVEAKEKGLGRYDIAIKQWDALTGKEKTYKNEIVRGEVTDTVDLNQFWSFPSSNAFGGKYSNVYGEEGGKVYNTQTPQDRKYYVDELKKVPSYSSVFAYFGFEKDITLKEFEKMYKGSKGLNFSYVAVKTAEEGTYQNVLGFEPTGSGIILEKGVVPEKSYPYFEMGNHIDELKKNPVKVWDSHFKTLLKYMSTREEFLGTMANVNNVGTEFYKNALSYVNKNGINVYGVLVHGSAEDVLAFEHKSNILGIVVENIKLSPLSK